MCLTRGVWWWRTRGSPRRCRAVRRRGSGRFCLYGDTTGETDEYGLPVRYPWAEDYRGEAMVVYGHTPIPEAAWVNGTICIDTGCVFGGKLTALRYPERELVSVTAGRVYYEPAKPLDAAQSLSAQSLSAQSLSARAPHPLAPQPSASAASPGPAGQPGHASRTELNIG